MPNHVETKIWLMPKDGKVLTEKQIEEFFSQFISIDPDPRDGEDPRMFDFNTILPQSDNIWLGAVGGDEKENLEGIEKYGGLDAVKQDLKERKSFPLTEQPCLTDEQIKRFGMVNGLSWNREHWETKWGAYYCSYDFKSIFSETDYTNPNVVFYTAWSVPEQILRMVREKALEQGYDIWCEFGGELDNPGEYTEGVFMYWNAVLDEMNGTLERQGDPIDVHE